MKKIMFSFMLSSWISIFCQQKIEGKVVNDDNDNLDQVTVINMSTDQKLLTNSSGEFSIEASKNDELRFVKKGYERFSKKVLIDGINSRLNIKLVRVAEEIEEVKLVKLTGDLDKDSRKFAKVDQSEIVEQAVGLPKPVGKMRETPAEVKKVLIGALLGALDIQGIYDLISGKARRQKRAYRYFDLQDEISWLRNRIDDEYFIESGIPADRVSEFVEFSFHYNPQVRNYARAKNLSATLFRIDEAIPVFIERLKTSKK
jgi:hypothetical protein